jgi:hypothetical protein
MHVLSRRYPHVSLAGRATHSGFIILGDLPTEAVAGAAQEALRRLQAGQSELAIHPRCGTNFVAAGVLAGLSSLVATWRQPRRLLDRLPRVIVAATAAVLMAQPLGLWLQERVTTSPHLVRARIGRVSRRQLGAAVSHHVEVWDQDV